MADETDTEVDDVGGNETTAVQRRIATITRKRREAEEALRAAEEKNDQLEAQLNDFKKQAKQWESVQAELEQVKAERTAWAEEKAMIGLGLTDPEGIDLARLAYNRMKPEDRPKGGIAEWLGEREKLPRGVQAYLPEAGGDKGKTGAGTGKDAGKPNTTVKQPDTDRKAKTAAGAPTTYQGGSVSQMGVDEVAASREAIWASLNMKAPNVNIPGITKPAEKK